MWAFSLSAHEVKAVQALTHEIASEYKSVEDPQLIRRATIYAHELPRRIRQFLTEFKLLEPTDGVCLISGYPIDNTLIGKTPSHWKWKLDTATLEAQIMFLLFGCLLGDPFAWATQQDGYLMHDVFPIEGDKYDQLGSGSEQTLFWHTEDAFHPHRADYLGLMCLRNPDGVATTLGAPDISRLSPEQLDVLFQPRYLIKPDESHSEKNESDLRKQARQNNGGDGILDSAYEHIRKLNTAPAPVSMLFGSREMPYVRLDPYFTTPIDDEAGAALNALAQSVDDNIQDVALQPGDCIFIDNYRIVHGRKAFKARYDGTDRWLKRINLTRDLRKSHGSRGGCEMRVMV